MDNTSELFFSDIDDLVFKNKNPHKHSRHQLGQITKSIEAFGFKTPIVIDEKNVIIAGEARVQAAKELGIKKIPCLRFHDLTDAQKKAFALADNKLPELADWDTVILADDLIELSDPEFKIDMSDFGFSITEQDLLIEAAHPEDNCEEDDIPLLPVIPVSREGDLWLLGKHRLYCGNAREPSAYEELLGDETADVVATDPPYNVPIQGHAGGKGKHKHREFAEATGELSDEAFEAWLEEFVTVVSQHLRKGGLLYCFMDWRSLDLVVRVGRKVLGPLLNIGVWVKTNAGMGSFYRSQHECCAIIRHRSEKHRNNIELGRHGRNRSNVWTYPGQSAMSKSRDETLALHPTVKPTALIADILKDCTKRGDLVLDPFAGSGTVFLAAERTGRVARGIELDPAYVDVAIRRWQELTGKEATLVETGETFDDTAADRAAKANTAS